ncbi:aldo/keto reductase [Pseudomonas brassicacearum]|uniref:aldo/keto reductase n=1 Tax=Pseudomonas brassicacearum TaxID=930166 RepID=UPI00046CC893|nr:aldo/keto reductase [Pseudomonas brassicacearum]
MKISEKRRLPRSSLELGVFGLGCSQVGGLYREVSADQATQTLQAAWNRGIRYYDTAPFYGYSRSERRVGTELAERPRADFILSTKVGRLLRADGSVRNGDDGWANPLPFRPVYDYGYDAIMRSYEDSLQRLGVCRIDILYVHDIGRLTHGERHQIHWDQLTRGGGFRALESLREDGAIAAIGLGVNEWEVVQDSMNECQLDCTLLAGRYTLLDQQSLAPLMNKCLGQGNSVVVGGVFNSGILAGGTHFDYGEAPAAVIAKVQALKTVCEEFEVPLPAAALQFPMAHPAVVSCVVGTRTPQQLDRSIAWFEQDIPEAFWKTLQARELIDADAPLPQGAL